MKIDKINILIEFKIKLIFNLNLSQILKNFNALNL